MKGPSLDAIRKFKERQERLKREEDEKKAREKLSTLGHRAAQGDRKAKLVLKKIEKIEQEKSKTPQVQPDLRNNVPKTKTVQPTVNGKVKSAKPRPLQVETDFEELMKMAKQNTNEIIRPEEPKSQSSTSKTKIRAEHSTKKKLDVNSNQVKKAVIKTKTELDTKQARIVNRGPPSRDSVRPSPDDRHLKKPVIGQKVSMPPPKHAMNVPQRYQLPPNHSMNRPYQVIRQNPIHHYHDRYYDEEDEEDDYEEDDFVVDDDEEEVQDELQKTIRSVFRYDKRRCDLREEELDRQYRAIGRVSTFEDLEREERRASKLAAAEDAKAFREEEERKKMKKLRLQK